MLDIHINSNPFRTPSFTVYCKESTSNSDGATITKKVDQEINKKPISG